MAWVAAYDEQTRDCAFLSCPYDAYRKACLDAPKTPECDAGTTVGVCQRHLLHIWKFAFAVYKTERELPDCRVEEVEQVSKYVLCELNFAALSWTSPKQAVPAVIHCFQRLKQFISFLKGISQPREADQTLDFYLRKQFPVLRSDLKSVKALPTSTEVHLIALIERLFEFQRDGYEPNSSKSVKIPQVDDSPAFYDAFSSASEPVTPFRPPALREPSQAVPVPSVPIGETTTVALLSEMCGQVPTSLSVRMQKFRSGPEKSRACVNFSVYKDSPQYANYAKQFPAKKSIVLDFQLPGKVSEVALEDHGNLDQLDQGKWLVPEQPQRSGTRIRTEKAPTKSVTMRQRVDSRTPFDPIFEEPERKASEIREEDQESDLRSETHSQGDAVYREIKEMMQSLATLTAKEPQRESTKGDGRPRMAALLGRTPAPLFSTQIPAEKLSESTQNANP